MRDSRCSKHTRVAQDCSIKSIMCTPAVTYCMRLASFHSSSCNRPPLRSKTLSPCQAGRPCAACPACGRAPGCRAGSTPSQPLQHMSRQHRQRKAEWHTDVSTLQCVFVAEPQLRPQSPPAAENAHMCTIKPPALIQGPSHVSSIMSRCASEALLLLALLLLGRRLCRVEASVSDPLLPELGRPNRDLAAAER